MSSDTQNSDGREMRESIRDDDGRETRGHHTKRVRNALPAIAELLTGSIPAAAPTLNNHVETVPIQTRPSGCVPCNSCNSPSLTLLPGESAVGKSRCVSLLAQAASTHTWQVLSCGSSRTSSMTIARVRLEVRPISLEALQLSHRRPAAFLTQTVTLDDQTTVKFEIWYVPSHSARSAILIHCRDTAGQERYKVCSSVLQFTLPVGLTINCALVPRASPLCLTIEWTGSYLDSLGPHVLSQRQLRSRGI